VGDHRGLLEALMAKVTGLGGAFLRAADPKALYVWYEEHLGVSSSYGSFLFPKETQRAYMRWHFFLSHRATFR
jgi:hypothetical protein